MAKSKPSILKFFIQLGHAEELGSGIQKVTKWLPSYGVKASPQFIEGSLFTTIIPLPEADDESKAERGQSSEKMVGDVVDDLGFEAVDRYSDHFEGVRVQFQVVRVGVIVVRDGIIMKKIKLSPTDKKILAYTEAEEEPQTKQILEVLGYKTFTRNVRNSLSKLREIYFIEYTIPENPNHPEQKYRLTGHGKKWLEHFKEEQHYE